MRPDELRSLRATGILALALVLSACATGSRGSSGGGGSADMITQQQIDDAQAGSAWEVIQRYRPRWLRPSRYHSTVGSVTAASRPGMPANDGDALANEVYPKVFVDGAPYGEVNSLSSISSDMLSSIAYVSATEATTRYGTGYVGGVIEVRTRSGN